MTAKVGVALPRESARELIDRNCEGVAALPCFDMLEILHGEICGGCLDRPSSLPFIVYHLNSPLYLEIPRIREQIVHEIQRVFEGKVVWGEDKMQLTFAGPAVTNIEGY